MTLSVNIPVKKTAGLSRRWITVRVTTDAGSTDGLCRGRPSGLILRRILLIAALRRMYSAQVLVEHNSVRVNGNPKGLEAISVEIYDADPT